MENKNLLEIFQALSDPIRLKIVKCLLKNNEKRLNPEEYEIAKSTLSHHVKILSEAEIIISEKEGVVHKYSLNKDFLNNNYPELLELIKNNL